jgi:cyclopropane fatty-acyl-phospholipid synthase-like methyltransferase
MDLDIYNITYDALLAEIPQAKAKVLEIGTGPGNITKYVLDKRPDLDLLGIDVAPNMVALAQKNNPTARFQVLDCRQLDTLQGPYQAVVCGFCTPYLAPEDVDKLLQDTAALLEKGGVVYISTIEGQHAQSGFEVGSIPHLSMYVYYYTEKEVQHKLIQHGFNTLNVWRIAYTTSKGIASTHMVFLAQK